MANIISISKSNIILKSNKENKPVKIKIKNYSISST